MTEVRLCRLGTIDYQSAFEVQREAQERVIAGDSSTLFLLEHPPVYTLGANFHEENLPLTPRQCADHGIQVARTDRGGDITYHGPGQVVAYPVFQLQDFGKDLHLYLRTLEQAFVNGCSRLGVEAEATPIHTGIWASGKIIGSIWIKVRRWVSMHGVAMNCSCDLAPFTWITPCGLKGHSMTSLSLELKREVGPWDAAPAILEGFEQTFNIRFREEEWEQA